MKKEKATYRKLKRLQTLLIAGCFFNVLSTAPASAFLLQPFATRTAPFCRARPHQSLKAAAATSAKDTLFGLLEQAPRNTPTSQQLTADILTTVRLLEKECPTPDAEVLQALAGPWELLWTAQDPQAPESNRLLLSWINPLENQSYSNNPSQKGRSNPILPRAIEDTLEEAGLTTSVGDFRSTQTIDMKSMQVINVVAVDINLLGKRQRATVTVLVDFVPNQTNARQIDVKFQACRFNVKSSFVDLNIPLGILGPRGWLKTVFIDDSIRITRGHKGSVFVLKRPGK